MRDKATKPKPGTNPFAPFMSENTVMSEVVMEPTLVAVTWRNRDGGGIATFEYVRGPVSSRPMSQVGAWQAAAQIFGEDCLFEERFDGGRRWTRPDFKPEGLPYH
jgi:hypothetical protein